MNEQLDHDVSQAMAAVNAAFRTVDLPQGFLQDCDQLECLACHRGLETFLVREKCSGRLLIAKCCSKALYTREPEAEILQTLSHDGLPAFICTYENEHMRCVVREYIEGMPLHEYLLLHPLSREQAVALCVQLCDILLYLHGQTPPVIHRDIKPQNIIVREDGRIALIDFDIARTYKDESDTDTQFIGTRAYAPPEQYGFTQTDCRADIYSLGVLLRFLLTGSEREQTGLPVPVALQRIIDRCTAFSPEGRYRDVRLVKRALLQAGGRRQYKALRAASLLLGAVLLLGLGFGLGRLTNVFPSEKGVSFQEPLMEKAVRVQLGKSETEPITTEELLAVEQIYLFGNEALREEGDFVSGLSGERSEWPRGGLTSLEDAVLLPNLKVLYVNYQQLSDISPIAALTGLECVSLRHTRVADISVLAGLPKLKSAVLYDTYVTDMSCLNACTRLTHLEAGETLIPGIDALPKLAPLEMLSLKQVKLPALDGIAQFGNLEHLYLNGTGVKDLSPLLHAPYLRCVYLDESMREAADALGHTSFEIQYE